MSDPGVFARRFGTVDVLTCSFAERGHPRLIPDPRPAMGRALAAPWASPRSTADPVQFVILIHPDDLDRLPDAMEAARKIQSARELRPV